MSLFRGWSRLCLHAASLSVAERISAATAAAARAARAQKIQSEAQEAADVTKARRRPTNSTTDEGQVGVESTALHRAEEEEGALHRQGAQLVRNGSGSSCCSLRGLQTNLCDNPC